MKTGTLKTSLRAVVFGGCSVLLSLKADAAITVSHVFGDGMVLQRDKPVPVWGWGDAGEAVSVTFGGQTLRTTVAQDGTWRVLLQPLKASSNPGEMVIGTIKIEDVLVGEVWFCSGQSNMEMPLGQHGEYRGVENFEQVIAAADNPQIRFLQIPHSTSGLPVPDPKAKWWKCTRESAQWSSAVAYFFGSKLQKSLGVPVGLINCAWGGSGIVAWTPAVGFAAVPGFEKELGEIAVADKQYASSEHLSREDWEKQVREEALKSEPVPPSAAWIDRPTLPPSGHPLKYPKPTGLYNGMVAPVVPFAIRGVIWYQGETNLGDGALYTKRMEALIAGWRHVWNLGDFPFYFVQVAPYRYRAPWPVKEVTPEMLPALWEAQRAALKIPNTGMVGTEDLGEQENIHPRRKSEIGERLAAMALEKTYGKGTAGN